MVRSLVVSSCALGLMFSCFSTPSHADAASPFVVAQGGATTAQPPPRSAIPLRVPQSRGLPRPPQPLPVTLLLNNPAGGGDRYCIVDTVRRVVSDRDGNPCRVEVTDRIELSLTGSPASLESTLFLMSPSGGRIAVAPSGESYIPSGSAYGQYQVISAGPRPVRYGEIWVQPSHDRALTRRTDAFEVMNTKSIVFFDLAGYAPSSNVTIHLYRLALWRNEGTGVSIYEYIGPIGSVVVDARGEQIVSVGDWAGVGPGNYLVVSAPPQASVSHRDGLVTGAVTIIGSHVPESERRDHRRVQGEYCGAAFARESLSVRSSPSFTAPISAAVASGEPVAIWCAHRAVTVDGVRWMPVWAAANGWVPERLLNSAPQ